MTSARTQNGYAPGELTVHRSPAAITPVTRALRGAGRKVALIPTMGALHEGHRELIRHARRAPGAVVTAVSIFVNPLQFGPSEDLDRYPRPLDADLEVCRAEGVELVFLPAVADMYPEGADTAVTPGRSATSWRAWCGPATSPACSPWSPSSSTSSDRISPSSGRRTTSSSR